MERLAKLPGPGFFANGYSRAGRGRGGYRMERDEDSPFREP